MATDSCPKLAELEGVYIAIATGDTTMADGDAVRAALAHAESCPACSAELAAYRKLHQRLTPPRLPDDAAARIAVRIRAAAHARIRAWERRRRLLRRVAALAAVGAVAVLAAGLWRLREGVEPSSQRIVAPAPSPMADAEPASSKGLAAPRRGAHPQLRRRPITPEQKEKLEQAARLRETGARHVRRREYAESRQPLRQAIVLTDDVLREAPGGQAGAAALYEKYRCYQLLGDYLARESCLRDHLRAIRQSDGDEAAGRALLEDARRLIRERDFETAGRRLERALALCPAGKTALAAHLLMAQAAERQGLHDLACSQYEMALAQGPPPALAARMYRAMISTSTRNGNFDLAVEHAEKLCALPEEGIAPADRVVHLWILARLYAQRGSTGQAVRLLRHAIDEHKPKDTELARLELQALADRTLDVGHDGIE